MILKRIIVLTGFSLFLFSCAEINKTKKIIYKDKTYYSSNGFALIYDETLFKNKVIRKNFIDNEVYILHNFLKKNTPITITNPDNNKIIKTIVNKKADYPKIFNIVISDKIASDLSLDINNPYVEIIEHKKNKTFIAKEGSIFDEEKKVAAKAPVEEIEMDSINETSNTKKVKLKKTKSFILVISDFYYIDSANNLKNDISKKTNIKNISVKKINNKKFRLLVGPFKNFNALKNTYISLNNLGFEDLNINKN